MIYIHFQLVLKLSCDNSVSLVQLDKACLNVQVEYQNKHQLVTTTPIELSSFPTLPPTSPPACHTYPGRWSPGWCTGPRFLRKELIHRMIEQVPGITDLDILFHGIQLSLTGRDLVLFYFIITLLYL